MIIHHYHPFSKNIGDLLVVAGIHKLAKQYLGDVSFVSIPVNRNKRSLEADGLSGKSLTTSLKEADLILIGGSNLLEGPCFGHSWGVRTSSADIERITKPVAVVGIGGGGALLQEEDSISEEAKKEIFMLAEKSLLFSVRDVRALKVCNDLGIKNAILTGCPASYIGRVPYINRNIKKILISLPPARFHYEKLKDERGKNISSGIEASFKEILMFLTRNNYELKIIAHDIRDLNVWDIGDFNSRIELIDEAQTLIKVISEADFLVSYRLHMGITGLGFGIPSLLFDMDNRIRGFVQTYNLDQATVSRAHLNNPNETINRLSQLLAKPEETYVDAIKKREQLYDAMEKFWQSIGNLNKKGSFKHLEKKTNTPETVEIDWSSEQKHYLSPHQRLQLISEWLKGPDIKSIADLGCGPGSLSELLPADKEYIGFDNCITNKLNALKGRLIQANIGNAPDLNLLNKENLRNHFDVVVLSGLLEYLENFDPVMDWIDLLLSKEGKVIVSYVELEYFKHHGKPHSGWVYGRDGDQVVSYFKNHGWKVRQARMLCHKPMMQHIIDRIPRFIIENIPGLKQRMCRHGLVKQTIYLLSRAH